MYLPKLNTTLRGLCLTQKVQSQEKRGQENWRRRGQKVREKKRDPRVARNRRTREGIDYTNIIQPQEKRREGKIRRRKRAENYRKIKKEKRVKTTREETRSEKKKKRLEYYKRKIDRRTKSRETNWITRDESGSTQKRRRSGIDTRRGLKPKRRSFEMEGIM